jgi:hypothetical protein
VQIGIPPGAGFRLIIHRENIACPIFMQAVFIVFAQKAKGIDPQVPLGWLL